MNFPAGARVLKYAWAAPNTAVGLVLGLIGWLSGASARLNNGTVEFAGGRLFSQAALLPPGYSFCAITFGHVIIAADGPTLIAARRHEEMHVRQYERWGPFFVPAYLLSSVVQIMRGGNAYRDNYFERQAYGMDAGRKIASGLDK